VICAAQTYYSSDFPLTGYLELADKHREGMVATVELALACACADGTVDQRELRVIHRWMTAALAERSDDAPAELAKLKAGFNDAMKTGVRGGADVRSLCVKIHKLSLPSVSQSALTLCVDVIAADGELHADELKTVRSIARDLGLDYDKLQSLIDKQFVNSNVTSAQENLEAIVGIDPTWDKERIRKHLADQFMKWNSRAPAAKTVEDQARIRAMLDAVARLKKKYS
jgi:tellurite resistance protein